MIDNPEGKFIAAMGSREDYRYAWSDGAFLHEMPSKSKAMKIARELSETQGYDTKVLERKGNKWIIIREYKGGRLSMHKFGKEMY